MLWGRIAQPLPGGLSANLGELLHAYRCYDRAPNCLPNVLRSRNYPSDIGAKVFNRDVVYVMGRPKRPISPYIGELDRTFTFAAKAVPSLWRRAALFWGSHWDLSPSSTRHRRLPWSCSPRSAYSPAPTFRACSPPPRLTRAAATRHVRRTSTRSAITLSALTRTLGGS